MGLSGAVTLVMHDWGSALGFHWAHRHPDRVRALVYMEAIVRPVTWAEWPEAARKVFQGMRGPAGEEMVLQDNFFVETLLPMGVLRTLTPEEMTRYRAPFPDPESRRPTLIWPRQIPIDGEPADVQAIVEDYAAALARSPVPKLAIFAEPGAVLSSRARDVVSTWPNLRAITVRGRHFVQEDSPDEIGRALAQFVTDVRAGP
jgi:haloalkane dehalogenase